MLGRKSRPEAPQQSRGTQDLVESLDGASSAGDVSRAMSGMTREERRRAADALEALNATKELIRDLEYRRP